MIAATLSLGVSTLCFLTMYKTPDTFSNLACFAIGLDCLAYALSF